MQGIICHKLLIWGISVQDTLMRLLLILPFLTFLEMAAQVKAPRHRFLTYGFNVGMIGWSPTQLNNLSGSNSLTRTGNFGAGVLVDNSGGKHLSLIANTSFGIHAGFLWFDRNEKGFTSIQAEAQSNKACYEFNYPFPYSFYGDSASKWIEADKYIKLSLAIERGWLLNESSLLGGKSFWFIRESFGQTMFHRNIGDPYTQLITLNHQENWTQNQTGMTTQIVALNPQSWMLTSEIGTKSFSQDYLKSVEFGLALYLPFQSTFTEQYEFFKSGAEVGKSQINFYGATLMLNLRISISNAIKDKKPDTTKRPQTKKPHHIKQVNGRHLIVQGNIEVQSDSCRVLVWDDGTVDGDRITLYLNGALILEDYTLAKEKKEVLIHLVPGRNYLVMFALNLGSIPPNTAGMQVIDHNNKIHSFNLSSDMGKSGTIEINYRPK